ncbi:transcription factor che-1-like [Contarinia nasturtii]|uniref:transcription factor che-1-like n=1 Tax=Contarinia nasturtii TaxID=265458 RepID=UPI0012D4A018|nr:transcription factor che-1-like [Contarinia nasturtii]XP_031625076.1 transcription factor che-1-like [Contarinia nasturtii]XP_031625077.1 transcription factor che-1-like [Contarinia nasturtii]
MNFSPFGNPFSASISGIHQFAAGAQDSSNRYHNGSAASNVSNMNHCTQSNVPILSKFRGDDNLSANAMHKYNGHNNSNISNNPYQSNVPTFTQTAHLHANNDDKQRLPNSYQPSNASNAQVHQSSEITPDICSALLNQQTDAKRVLQNVNSGWQSLTPSSAVVADYLSHLPASTLPLSLHHFLKYSAESIKKESQNQLSNIDMAHAQGLGLNSLSSSLLSNAAILNQNQQNHMIPSQQQQHHSIPPQIPTSQQQHSHPNGASSGNNNLIQTSSANVNQTHSLTNNTNGSNGMNNSNELNANNNTSSKAATTTAPTKKKKKKKPPKEKKPRPKPGEIRLTTALDGSTLYGCPECHMVYPERGLLEEHLVGHNLERRFICDICNAALKRKDHLTRHKQSHNEERPFVCTVCMKAFKRKEQLTLHFVIHSGEKKHVCQECGKGFYRKDHLRKHTKSHIARRVKAELSQSNQSPNLLAAQQLQNQGLTPHQLQLQQNTTTFS